MTHSYLVCYTGNWPSRNDNDGMVITYESKGNGVQRIGQAADLTQASMSLPAGSYTTYRTYGRDRVLRLSQHLRRLEESVLKLDSPGMLSDAVVPGVLWQILQDTGYTESRFRLTFVPPRLFLSVEPFVPYPRA